MKHCRVEDKFLAMMFMTKTCRCTQEGMVFKGVNWSQVPFMLKGCVPRQSVCFKVEIVHLLLYSGSPGVFEVAQR